MPSLKQRLVLPAVVLSLGATPLFAADWYVDAVSGSDANGGATPATAWRTLTHAIAATPVSGVQTIHVAPGVYGPALGEAFPLLMRPAMQLVGTAGSGATTIDGGGTAVDLIRIDDVAALPYIYFGADTVVRGLCLANARRGIGVTSWWGNATPTLEELVVKDMSVTGIEAFGLGGGAFGSSGGAAPTIRRVTCTGCACGLALGGLGAQSYASGLATCYAVIEDSDFSGNTVDGVRGQTGGVSESKPTFRRCRMTHNGGSGVHCDYVGFIGGSGDMLLEDCLLARNGASGFDGVAAPVQNAWATLNVTLRRCTLAANPVYGVHAVSNYFTQTHAATLESTVLFGNGDDILQHGATVASFCDVGDGDFAGSSGNFSADPLFVDATNDDFRLKWASPCIETGAPTTPAGAIDLSGYARPIDGNLDTQEWADVGCFEFAPLYMVASGKLGTVLELQLWGEQGNATVVYFARKPLVAPQPTPFGELDLNQAYIGVYRVKTVGSGPPKKVVRPIPSSPAFAGLTFSFQALTDCSAAPQGKAYTNPVQLTLTL